MKNIYKFLSEKVDKGVVPLKPFEIEPWAQSECWRPLTAAVLLGIANSIKQTVDNVDALGNPRANFGLGDGSDIQPGNPQSLCNWIRRL